MPRMSIYLGLALKARIEARPDINWSKVAQDAFGEALLTIPRRDFIDVHKDRKCPPARNTTLPPSSSSSS